MPTTIIENISWIDASSPGGKALAYVLESLRDKLFILRVSPSIEFSNQVISLNENPFDAAAKENEPVNYLKDTTVRDNGFGEKKIVSYDRTLGSIFYRVSQKEVEQTISFVRNTFIEKNNIKDLIKDTIRASMYSGQLANAGTQVIPARFEEIMVELQNFVTRPEGGDNYYYSIIDDQDPLKKLNLNEEEIKLYNSYVDIKLLELLYSKASEWPLILWDEYYDDGTPATLNWEMVTANLASVYTQSLLYYQDSAKNKIGENSMGRMVP